VSSGSTVKISAIRSYASHHPNQYRGDKILGGSNSRDDGDESERGQSEERFAYIALLAAHFERNNAAVICEMVR